MALSQIAQRLERLGYHKAPQPRRGKAPPPGSGAPLGAGIRGQDRKSFPAWHWPKSFFNSLLEHVAQKWEPVLRYSDMRNQKVRVGRVNANERDPL